VIKEEAAAVTADPAGRERGTEGAGVTWARPGPIGTGRSGLRMGGRAKTARKAAAAAREIPA